MIEQNTDNTNLTTQNKVCRNCVGFQDCACYRRPGLILYLFGPSFVGPEDTCWKFKRQKTR